MQAEYLPDSTIAIAGLRSKVRFSRVVVGVGWPEQEDGYLCVVGARVDGRFHCIWESRGGLWTLGDSAKEAQSRFLPEGIILDPTDSVCSSYFRALDWSGGQADDTLKSIGLTSAKKKAEPIIIPVSKQTTDNFRSTLEMVKGMISNGRALVHTSNCPTLMYTLRRPLNDLVKSPVMKGLTWALWYLERMAVSPQALGAKDSMWYENAPR